MTLGDFLKFIGREGASTDNMIIFRDDQGGWDNVTAKKVGCHIEISCAGGDVFAND